MCAGRRTRTGMNTTTIIMITDHAHHHGDAHHRHTDHQSLGVEPHVHGPDCGHDHDHDHDHDHAHGHDHK